MAENIFDLTGKVALVTGGNGGIGLGMAEGLARAGADVVIWGQNPEKNALAEAKLVAQGGRVLVQRVDVSQEREIDAAVEEAVRVMGRLDFVAANAGVGEQGCPFEDLTTDLWRRTTTINIDGVFWTLRAACRHMVERARAGDPGGSLLVMSSAATINSPARAQAYVASKGAVATLVRSLAVEYARHGIRANAVLPGYVVSDMSAQLQDAEAFNTKVIQGRVPMKRWGQPEDFIGVAVYLASDLSRFHTGDRLVIDGAFTIS